MVLCHDTGDMVLCHDTSLSRVSWPRRFFFYLLPFLPCHKCHAVVM